MTDFQRGAEFATNLGIGVILGLTIVIAYLMVKTLILYWRFFKHLCVKMKKRFDEADVILVLEEDKPRRIKTGKRHVVFASKALNDLDHELRKNARWN